MNQCSEQFVLTPINPTSPKINNYASFSDHEETQTHDH